MSRRKSNYKVMACFDTETNNDKETETAYAITYQLSILKSHLIDCNLISNDNVNSFLDITIDRDFKQFTNRLDELIGYGKANGIIPVVMVHNLAFEMWILSPYISEHEADGCSKSTVKPLTINIKEDGNTVLVFWDTLSFWAKPLGKLGDECKYPKLTGCWDYLKQRTPETPLTEMETAYAKEDVVVPWAYLGYYLRLNPEINEHDLAYRILTKTSAVRYKSMKRCGNIRFDNITTGKIWYKRNKKELPKTDHELEMIHAAARGGFTYCARNCASVVYEKHDDMHILKYDANSMHICHALAHKVPSNYRLKPKEYIMAAFNKAISVTLNDMLANYSNPFIGCKFYGVFRFTNVRLKVGSVFERDSISTFAASRFLHGKDPVTSTLSIDNQGGLAFTDMLTEMGWHDKASSDADFAFGKFYGASWCEVILNEMSAWEFHQQFDYDTVDVLDDGYLTGHAEFATEKSLLSFNNFYKAKTIFKRLKERYERHESFDDVEFPDFIPSYLADAMRRYDSEVKTDVEAFYLSVKSELNALYGIEATNEAKNEILLTKNGYIVGEYEGVNGLPERPKAWYQYGTHIVGWSRIHQIIFMLLLQDDVERFICGDTDSHKIYTRLSPANINDRLRPLHDACNCAIEICTIKAREISEWYPMDCLGWYECEGEVDSFYAAWNKAYIQLHDGVVDITMAGVPCDNRFRLSDGTIVCHSYNAVANNLYNTGWSFARIAELLVGYNVFVTHDITGLNQRKLPKWNTVDDRYNQPNAIYLYPMTKAIGNTDSYENYINSTYAKANNPDVNIEPVIIDWKLDKDEPSVIRL